MANILEVFINGDAKDLNKSLSSAQSKLKAFGKQTTEIGKRLSTRLTLPIGLAGAAAVKAASDFERLKTSLGVLTGGAEQGAKAFERLVKFSAKTPFQLKDLAAVNNQLIGFGMTTNDAFNSLKLLGDVSAVAGADLTRVAVAFGQSAAAGRVMQQDINQFINNGIPIYKILNGVTGASVDQLRKMGSEGKITFDLLKRGFIAATSEGGQFENGMEKLSQTFAGQFSTLKDNLNIALAEFGKILLPILKDLMSNFTGLIQRLSNLDKGTQRLILGIASLGAALPPLLIVFGSFATVIAAIASPIGLVVAGIVLLATRFNEIRNVARDFEVTIKTGLLNIFVKLKAQVELFLNGLGRLKAIFKELITNKFSADLDSVNKKFDEQADAIKESRDNAVKLNNEVSDLIKANNNLEPTLDVIKRKAKAFSNSLFGVAKKAKEAKVELSDIFKPAKFNFLPKLIKQSNTWKGLLDDITESTKTLADIEEKRAKIVEDKLNYALGVGSSVTNVLIDSFNNLKAGGNFFQPIIKGLEAMVTRLIAAATAAAILSVLLPKFLGGKDKAFKVAFAALSGIPKFADGGIVSAPTLGLMGEYPGARSNPEVVAPLDKLKSMIGGGQTNVTVSGGFRLDGQDLILALERANRNNKRFA